MFWIGFLEANSWCRLRKSFNDTGIFTSTYHRLENFSHYLWKCSDRMLALRQYVGASTITWVCELRYKGKLSGEHTVRKVDDSSTAISPSQPWISAALWCRVERVSLIRISLLLYIRWCRSEIIHKDFLWDSPNTNLVPAATKALYATAKVAESQRPAGEGEVYGNGEDVSQSSNYFIPPEIIRKRVFVSSLVHSPFCFASTVPNVFHELT